MYMELSLLFLLLFLPSSSLVLQTQPCPSRLVLFCILACFFYKMCCTKLSSQGDLFPSPWDPSSCSWSPAVWPVSWVISVTCSGSWAQQQLLIGSSATWITSRVVPLDVLWFYWIEHVNVRGRNGSPSSPALPLFLCLVLSLFFFYLG